MNALTCESCDPLLIDLALGELDDSSALAVRAHADTCDACSRALARLTAGRRAARELVMVEPPSLSAVLVAARARAAEVNAARLSEPSGAPAVAAVSAPPPEPARGSFFDDVLRWLGAWAARPQVAMATVFVLMVGIGLWYVPQLRWRQGGDPDGLMVEPDTTGEIGPSTGVEPAEPLALGVDPHTQRVELETERGAEERDVRPTTELATAEHATTTAPLAPSVPHARTTPTAADEGADSEDVVAVTDVVSGEALGRVEEGALPELATTTSETAIALAPPPPSTDATDVYRTAPMVAQMPTTSPPPSSPRAPSTAPRSMEADDVAPPSDSAAALLPNAIHRQARSLASAGRCGEAIPRYETLLRDHPEYADAPRAMLELGECQRQLGRLDAAASWIARAERFPSVSADARRARVRLEAQVEASERAEAMPTTSVPATTSTEP
jgi:hypothetical protein